MSLHLDLVHAYAARHGARATWFVRAWDAADVLAKTGVVGTHDRLVACADDRPDRVVKLFRWQRLSFAAAPEADAFLSASTGVNEAQAEAERLVPQGSPASYAHPAGMSSGRLFWLVPSVSAKTLRVADIRAFAQAAKMAGATLVVDNTLPTVFGCRPLALGAHISLESLMGTFSAAVSEPVVAVSVARSQRKQGRHQVADPYAEDAFRLLSFGLGAPSSAAGAARPSDADLAAVAAALDELPDTALQRFDHARAIASYLSCHSSIGCVRYPGFATHPDRDVAARVLEHGFGAYVNFTLTGSGFEGAKSRCERFLKLFEEVRATAFDDACGANATRLALVEIGDLSYLQIYAGLDDPIDVVDSLDQALRLFCNPPEP